MFDVLAGSDRDYRSRGGRRRIHLRRVARECRLSRIASFMRWATVVRSLVADGVTIAVVDGLEIVEIEADDGEDAAATLGLSHRVLEAVAKKHAIGQAGEEVVLCDAPRVLLVFLIRGDVGEEGDIVLRFCRICRARR